ncbi:hypothetical protein SDC9_204383 [bioreactor metagenome]|uniref:DUF340 domain-containing protein n=1 Tax=bioreactor metagenome TaxID=1076179 RepID=A0A645J0S4_9ZZZZ
MQYYLFAIIGGALIGALICIAPKAKKILTRFQEAGVYLLVASMGVSIGLNKDLISKIPSLGFAALITAFLCTLGSVLAVYFIGRLFLKEKKEARR